MNPCRHFVLLALVAAAVVAPTRAPADEVCGPGYRQSGTQTEKRGNDTIIRPICDPDPTFPTFRYTGAWDASDTLKQQRRSIDRLVDNIPDHAFKAWVKRNVIFDRVSRPQTPRLGVVPGRIIVYDSFWDRDQIPAAQINLLIFELGKALWFDKINSGPREARTPNEMEFNALFRQHERDIEATKFASGRGENLGHLSDRDPQSWFAYACRAVVFNLDPPSSATSGWRKSKLAVKEFLLKIIAER